MGDSLRVTGCLRVTQATQKSHSEIEDNLAKGWPNCVPATAPAAPAAASLPLSVQSVLLLCTVPAKMTK